MLKIQAGEHVICINGDPGSFSLTMTADKQEEGLFQLRLLLQAEEAAAPPKLMIHWGHPAVDIQGIWNTNYSRRDKMIGADLVSKSTSHAPVISLYNMKGQNRHTFAFSDALNTVRIGSWIIEEEAEFGCKVILFQEPVAPLKMYEAVLRLDSRDMPFEECIRQITAWWEAMPSYAPAPVPDTARLPMYSTWYSFHQNFTDQQVEEQCRLAKQIGCEAVIVDDGWQTDNRLRGYSFCGDWKVAPSRIHDMKAHVARVQAAGLKYLLWYSVPFLGINSDAWQKFDGKTLEYVEEFGAAILDPRFPEVREYLICTYEKALQEWNIDGFKLDFVDSFRLPDNKRDNLGGGRDYDSVPEAVDRLLTDVMLRLRALKPDVMIEFRQSYIGPLMRKYGNIFRVSDCPNDPALNRVGSLDLRLFSGSTAVHSDMIMWHPDDTPESVAIQLQHTMFSVPQISVLLDRLSDDHAAMLSHWLAFWRAHREVLLDGVLHPKRPDLLYPMVMAVKDDMMVVGVYGDFLIDLLGEFPARLRIVNGTLSNRILLENPDVGPCKVQVYDCKGELVLEETKRIEKGLRVLPVPPAGILFIDKL